MGRPTCAPNLIRNLNGSSCPIYPDSACALRPTCRSALLLLVQRIIDTAVHPYSATCALMSLAGRRRRRRQKRSNKTDRLLLAQSGHFTAESQCPLLGVKRTFRQLASMSAFDPKRTFAAPVCCDATKPPHPINDVVDCFSRRRGRPHEAARLHCSCTRAFSFLYE
jgi:hypothetical protein